LRKIKILLLIVSLFSGCSSNRVNTEFEFGNKLAKNGLWKEAYFRWSKALESGKERAAVYNNLAVSLEFQNRLKEAESKYLKALKLSPSNEYIKRNLIRLRKRINPEINEKSSNKNRSIKRKEKDKRSKE